MSPSGGYCSHSGGSARSGAARFRGRLTSQVKLTWQRLEHEMIRTEPNRLHFSFELPSDIVLQYDRTMLVAYSHLITGLGNVRCSPVRNRQRCSGSFCAEPVACHGIISCGSSSSTFYAELDSLVTRRSLLLGNRYDASFPWYMNITEIMGIYDLVANERELLARSYNILQSSIPLQHPSTRYSGTCIARH